MIYANRMMFIRIATTTISNLYIDGHRFEMSFIIHFQRKHELIEFSPAMEESVSDI